MRITEGQLRQIIREAISLRESDQTFNIGNVGTWPDTKVNLDDARTKLKELLDDPIAQKRVYKNLSIRKLLEPEIKRELEEEGKGSLVQKAEAFVDAAVGLHAELRSLGGGSGRGGEETHAIRLTRDPLIELSATLERVIKTIEDHRARFGPSLRFANKGHKERGFA